MLWMIVGRRGNHDSVDFLRVRNLLVRVRPKEKLRRIDRRVALCLLDLIEMAVCRVELVAEQIAKRYDAGVPGVDKIGRVLCPAPSATQQANPHRGIGSSTTHQRRLDEHHASSSSGGLQKFSPIELA